MDFDKTRRIANMLGIKVDNMTIYKAELIHMRNDNLTAEKIAKELNTSASMVQNWYDKGSQPKAKFICMLEKRFFERENGIVKKLRNPTS